MGGWVASIDFEKTVGPIFKIRPVDKVIQEIKFGQELLMPLYYRHFGFLLYSKFIHRFFTKDLDDFFVNLFIQYFYDFFFTHM